MPSGFYWGGLAQGLGQGMQDIAKLQQEQELNKLKQKMINATLEHKQLETKQLKDQADAMTQFQDMMQPSMPAQPAAPLQPGQEGPEPAPGFIAPSTAPSRERLVGTAIRAAGPAHAYNVIDQYLKGQGGAGTTIPHVSGGDWVFQDGQWKQVGQSPRETITPYQQGELDLRKEQINATKENTAASQGLRRDTFSETQRHNRIIEGQGQQRLDKPPAPLSDAQLMTEYNRLMSTRQKGAAKFPGIFGENKVVTDTDAYKTQLENEMRRRGLMPGMPTPTGKSKAGQQPTKEQRLKGLGFVD